MSQGLAIFTLTIFATGVCLWLVQGHRRLKLPPDFKFPTSATELGRPHWELYKEWSEWCGNALIHLRLHQSDVIVINKASAAHDLLEKRALNYSSRPQFHMMKLIGRQDNVVVQQYGPRLRVARRLINDTFGARKSDDWIPVVQKESFELLSGILSSPKDFRHSIQRYVGTFIVRLTYGQQLDADYLRLIDQVSEHTSQAIFPGRWWVNTYPLLRYYPSWAPGGGFQRWATNARELFSDFTSKPFNRVKEQLRLSPSNVPYSFVQKNLASVVADNPEMESVVSGTAASLYSAAVDTIASILATFFLIMATHPQIQAKAALEIQQVIGRDRLPNLGDADNLPYVEALIKELHRFHPAVPLLTRSASGSDVYEGSFIPRNAYIMTNIWGITHDEDVYEDPRRFDPERYMQKTDREGSHMRDPRDYTFGLGRRRCPGAPIANAAVYFAITGVLASFSIELAADEGSKLVFPFKFTKSTISSPLPFPCLIQPRYNGVQNLIEQAILVTAS